MRPEHKEEMKARARNIALEVSYDGTSYHGFQRQSPPIRAVANVLEEKLSIIFGDSVELAAAGRTDAGVHAYGQVVNFFTDGRIPIDRICRAANSLLPDDIVVRRAAEVDDSFSARHDARGKTYLYHILQGNVPDPMKARYAWYIQRQLDVAAMKEALGEIIGIHDFSSFRAADGHDFCPIREMKRVSLRQKGNDIYIEIEGTGFLYHMVRNLVGTLVAVGSGKLDVAGFRDILAVHDRSLASATAPAKGLCLMNVVYDEMIFNP